MYENTIQMNTILIIDLNQLMNMKPKTKCSLLFFKRLITQGKNAGIVFSQTCTVSIFSHELNSENSILETPVFRKFDSVQNRF